jgi:hypothetical protein
VAAAVAIWLARSARGERIGWVFLLLRFSEFTCALGRFLSMGILSVDKRMRRCLFGGKKRTAEKLFFYEAASGGGGWEGGGGRRCTEATSSSERRGERTRRLINQ